MRLAIAINVSSYCIEGYKFNNIHELSGVHVWCSVVIYQHLLVVGVCVFAIVYVHACYSERRQGRRILQGCLLAKVVTSVSKSSSSIFL